MRRGRPPYRRTYETTHSDVEAARILGVPQFRFTRWRRSRGLPSKYEPGGTPLRPNVELARRAAYESTRTDREAAAAAGVSKAAFSKWREYRLLPAKPKTPRPRASDAEVLRWFVAWEMTNNDREAAELLGMSYCGFNVRRRRWLRVPAHNVPTIGHRGRLIRGREEERRMAVYRLGLSDREAAKILGIHRASFQGWRGYRKLPSARWTDCASCGLHCLPRRGTPKFCTRCKRELAARRRNRWLNDGEFRAHVRSLDGQRVTVRYFTGRRDPPFTNVVGILKVLGIGSQHILVGNTKVPKRHLANVRPEYRGEMWPCGCGCGDFVTFASGGYQPTHPPPFFIAGHTSRRPQFREKARKELAKYRGWNRGLHGEAFWRHYSPEARERMVSHLMEEHRRAMDRATHVVHDEKGHVYVRVPGRFPSGAARIKARARIVMERVLGRELRPDEMVAHLNGVPDDDRLENLLVIHPNDRPALAWGTKRGLTGQDLVRWISEMRAGRELEPREQRRKRRETRRRLASRVVEASPICPSCGMLRTISGSCRCRPSLPGVLGERVPDVHSLTSSEFVAPRSVPS